MIFPRIAASLAALTLSFAVAPSLACDMVPPPEVTNDFSEKVHGWMVWKTTPRAGFEGHMLTGHFNRRAFPPSAQEKAFLEGEIGKAVTMLYKTRATSIRLDAPSTPVPQDDMQRKTDARAFSLSLAFGGTPIAAPGYMRINKNRKDIALIVAFADPAHKEAAAVIARNTMMHPGFDCTAGDGP